MPVKGGGILNSLTKAADKVSSVAGKAQTTLSKLPPPPPPGVSATNYLKATAQAAVEKKVGEAAVNAAVKDIPGGANTVKLLGNMGISKGQLATTGLNIYKSRESIITRIQNWFLDPANRTILLGGFFFIVVLIAIGVGVYFSQKASSNFQNVEAQAGVRTVNAQNVANSLSGGAAVKGGIEKKEKFQNPAAAPVSEEDLRLINLQPLTIKQAGYIGPLRSGVFSERDGVQQALRAGFRTFILQIDYHEDDSKVPPAFPVKGEPCLLYRDDAGVLTSINAGSIRKTAEALADLAFQETLNAKYDPILLVLHGLRAPDSVVNPKGYLEYCSKIASQLKALAPFHLGLTSEGDYHRQALAGQLFTTGFSKFEKKIIILSTFDTSLFRTVDKLGMKPYAPADDLDYWVNAQLFKEDEKSEIGVASVVPTNSPLRSSVVELDKLIRMTEQEKKAWAVKNRDTFTVAIPSQNENPKKEVCDIALGTLGVNILPLDIFSSPIEETRDLLRSWQKKAWNLKPLALRSTVGKAKK